MTSAIERGLGPDSSTEESIAWAYEDSARAYIRKHAIRIYEGGFVWRCYECGIERSTYFSSYGGADDNGFLCHNCALRKERQNAY